MHDIIKGYNDSAEALISKFESIASPELYAPVAHLLDTRPSRIIDIGAGVGRDAAWFASHGHAVLAVEPVLKFREAGQRLHQSARIAWLDDTLPELARVLAREEVFDLITLSAVWQHLNNAQRKIAMPHLRSIAAPGGSLVMSLRHGPGAADRKVFPVSIDETINLAVTAGFKLAFEKSAPSVQAANRDAGVTWTWLIFSH